MNVKIICTNGKSSGVEIRDADTGEKIRGVRRFKIEGEVGGIVTAELDFIGVQCDIVAKADNSEPTAPDIEQGE